MPDISIDLDDLEITELDVDSAPDSSLELLSGGHLMTEVGASAVGPNVFVCSCCCCC